MVARGIKEVIRGLKLSVLFPWIPGRGERLVIVSVARDQRFNQSWLCNWASLVVQTVKNLPAMQETQVQCLNAKKFSGEGNGYPLFCNNTLPYKTAKGQVHEASNGWIWRDSGRGSCWERAWKHSAPSYIPRSLCIFSIWLFSSDILL